MEPVRTTEKKISVTKIYGIKLPVAIVVLVLIGLILSVQLWSTTENKFKARSLEEATIVASSIDINRIISLSGTANDTLSADYWRLNRQLNAIRTNHKSCKFLYLMKQRENGQVYFISDSQDTTSEDYLVPGYIYDDISEEYLSVFESKVPACVGPVTDQWGTVLTSLIPIFDSEGRLLAILGMDTEVDRWNRELLREASAPLLLIFATIVVILFFILQHLGYRALKQQYEEHLLMMDELLEAAAADSDE